MKIKDLAEYCKSIKIDCDNCEHRNECYELETALKHKSAYGVVQLVENNEEIEVE